MAVSLHWSRFVVSVWRYCYKRSFLVLLTVVVLTVGLFTCWRGLVPCRWLQTRMEFTISKTWDDIPNAEFKLNLSPSSDGLHLAVSGPFYNDPPNPDTPPGMPKQQLWEFEVVEVFFLNDERQYLEVELCPHGQHLVLLLSDVRKPFKDLLPLAYSATIEGSTWRGEAVIPWNYFPPSVSRFNAYAIHGSGERRTYQALFPVPHGKFDEPDFHRLEYFGEIYLNRLRPLPNLASRDDAIQFWH